MANKKNKTWKKEIESKFPGMKILRGAKNITSIKEKIKKKKDGDIIIDYTIGIR